MDEESVVFNFSNSLFLSATTSPLKEMRSSLVTTALYFDISKLFDVKNGSDVIIVLDERQDKPFHCHLFLLSFISTPLKLLIEAQLKSNSSFPIQLHLSENWDAMECLLKLMYGININFQLLDKKIFLSTLALAYKYDVLQVKENLASYFKLVIKPEDASLVFFHLQKELLSNTSLKETCIQFVTRTTSAMDQPFMSDVWNNVDEQLLVDLLSNDQLYVDKEESVMHIVMKWIGDKDWTKHKRLIECIRFPFIDEENLLFKVKLTKWLTMTQYYDILEYNTALKISEKSKAGQLIRDIKQKYTQQVDENTIVINFQPRRAERYSSK